MADDGKVVRAEFDENPTREIVADGDDAKEAILIDCPTPRRALQRPLARRHRRDPGLDRCVAAVATWLKDCADKYAAATAYEICRGFRIRSSSFVD
jgi:hypothetical protein